MPYKKKLKFNKKKDKKNYKMTKYNRYGISSIGNGGTILYKGVGMPERFFTKLAYTDVIVMNSANTLQKYIFRANALYDPDYTGTGSQPAYRDQLAQIYAAYRVFACKIEVTYMQYSDSANTGDLIAGLVPTISPTLNGIGAVVDIMSLPRVKYVMLSHNGPAIAKTKHFVKTKDLFSQKYTNAADGNNALVTADPGSLWYWCLFREPADLTSASSQVKAVMRMTQYVEFSQRLDLPLS